MAENKFDLAVLGSGPGGYPAAIKAAQNGLSVALIEADKLGGTCLNRGCIPSKTLIANADILHSINESSQFGINVVNISFDYSKMAKRKDQVVDQLRRGVTGLMSANKITVIKGFGKFISPNEIKITGEEGRIIEAKQVIIATGSESREISAFPCDHKRILNSTSLLELTELPKSLVIIGGGIIGCEFASLYHTLGVQITILELLPTILPMESKTVSEALSKSFQKRGISIQAGVNVTGIEHTSNGIAVKLGNGQSVEAEIALVSVGRSLNTSKIGLDKAGVIVNDNGMIPVNDKMETNVPGIYAVGDIASKWWLAHVATHQGIVAANNVSGIEAHMHYHAIPSVIFTNPEIATVGMSLEQAVEKGYPAVTGAFPFQALGKSQATMQTEGFAQIIIDKRTGQILGAQVVGHEAGTLIAEMTVAIENELTIESIAETMHAHPTVSEAWMEAAFLVSGHPIHLPPKVAKKQQVPV